MEEVFLVKGIVESTEYMGLSTQREETRLVKALSEDEAEQKFVNFFQEKSDEYAVSYTAYSVQVLPIIQ